MWLIDELAEARIAEARERGAFDDLPGTGRPLPLNDDTLVAEELRAGYLLPELGLRGEFVGVSCRKHAKTRRSRYVRAFWIY